MALVLLFTRFFFTSEDFQVHKLDDTAFEQIKTTFLHATLMYIYIVVVGLSIHAQVTRELDDIIQSKSDFVTRMSHELRTPLTGPQCSLRHTRLVFF
jgi:signal transduction histidine kinase